MGAGFFLRGLGVSGPSSTTILVGAGAAVAGWAAGACKRAIWASWAPIDCNNQAPSLPRPSSKPARASSRLAASASRRLALPSRSP